MLQHIGITLGEIELGRLGLILLVLPRVGGNEVVLHQMVVHVLDQSLDVLESLIELINVRFAHLVLHEQIVGTLTNVMEFIDVELDLG